MHWLNLHIPQLRSDECIGAEPVARATWVWVMAYCAEQENGGRVVGGASWKDRQWQQACGVTRDEVMGAAPLIRVERDDIVVHGYPKDKEAEVRAKRENGKRGGRPRNREKTGRKPRG